MTGGVEIAGLIPHAGRMILLDAVVAWDEGYAHCSTNSHRSLDNPLRHNGQLSAVHLCEYGAQAMAVHGGLLARRDGRKAAPGLVASLREVEFSVDRIDEIELPLDVVARMRIAGATGWVYEFDVSAEGRRLARGRVSVIPVR